MDGLGYSVTLRALNAQCSAMCTARSGDMADVIRQEELYDWGAQVVLEWSGMEFFHQPVSACVSVFFILANRWPVIMLRPVYACYIHI